MHCAEEHFFAKNPGYEFVGLKPLELEATPLLDTLGSESEVAEQVDALLHDAVVSC